MAANATDLIEASRQIVIAAEAAVANGGACGFWGDFRLPELIATGELLPSVCERQQASVSNLRLWHEQLVDELGRPFPDEERVETIARDIEEVAQGLVAEAPLSSFREFRRQYLANLRELVRDGARAVGETVGEVAIIAGDGLGEAAKGLFAGLGPVGTLVVVGLVLLYLQPNLLRGAR